LILLFRIPVNVGPSTNLDLLFRISKLWSSIVTQLLWNTTGSNTGQGQQNIEICWFMSCLAELSPLLRTAARGGVQLAPCRELSTPDHRLIYTSLYRTWSWNPPLSSSHSKLVKENACVVACTDDRVATRTRGLGWAFGQGQPERMTHRPDMRLHNCPIIASVVVNKKKKVLARRPLQKVTGQGPDPGEKRINNAS